jgi:hypothetical protein
MKRQTNKQSPQKERDRDRHGDLHSPLAQAAQAGPRCFAEGDRT